MFFHWGQKAFGGYLGDNRESWKEYDACELIKKYKGERNFEILSDQVCRSYALVGYLGHSGTR